MYAQLLFVDFAFQDLFIVFENQAKDDTRFHINIFEFAMEIWF